MATSTSQVTSPRSVPRIEENSLGECKAVYADALAESPDFDVLQTRIGELYSEAIEKGYSASLTVLTQAQGQLSLRRRRNEYVPAQECELKFTKVGLCNQFDVRVGNSACTNIVQYFLSQFLDFPKLDSITEEFIDKCLEQGTKNHDGWIDAQKKSGVQHVTNNLSHYETKDLYPLENIKVEQTAYQTRPDIEKSTAGCFHYLLVVLEQVMLLENGPSIGVVLTAHSETYGLALLRDGSTTIYVLFNSHGKERVGHPEKAYVISICDQMQMATELSKLIPHEKNTITDVPEEVIKWLEAEMKEDSIVSVIPVRYKLVDVNEDVLPASWSRRHVAATTTTATTNQPTSPRTFTTTDPKNDTNPSSNSGIPSTPGDQNTSSHPQGTQTNTLTPDGTSDVEKTTNKVYVLAVGFFIAIIGLLATFHTAIMQRITSFTTAHGMTVPSLFTNTKS